MDAALYGYYYNEIEVIGISNNLETFVSFYTSVIDVANWNKGFAQLYVYMNKIVEIFKSIIKGGLLDETFNFQYCLDGRTG